MSVRSSLLQLGKDNSDWSMLFCYPYEDCLVVVGSSCSSGGAEVHTQMDYSRHHIGKHSSSSSIVVSPLPPLEAYCFNPRDGSWSASPNISGEAPETCVPLHRHVSKTFLANVERQLNFKIPPNYGCKCCTDMVGRRTFVALPSVPPHSHGNGYPFVLYMLSTINCRWFRMSIHSEYEWLFKTSKFECISLCYCPQRGCLILCDATDVTTSGTTADVYTVQIIEDCSAVHLHRIDVQPPSSCSDQRAQQTSTAAAVNGKSGSRYFGSLTCHHGGDFLVLCGGFNANEIGEFVEPQPTAIFDMKRFSWKIVRHSRRLNPAPHLQSTVALPAGDGDEQRYLLAYGMTYGKPGVLQSGFTMFDLASCQWSACMLFGVGLPSPRCGSNVVLWSTPTTGSSSCLLLSCGGFSCKSGTVLRSYHDIFALEVDPLFDGTSFAVSHQQSSMVMTSRGDNSSHAALKLENFLVPEDSVSVHTGIAKGASTSSDERRSVSQQQGDEHPQQQQQQKQQCDVEAGPIEDCVEELGASEDLPFSPPMKPPTVAPFETASAIDTEKPPPPPTPTMMVMSSAAITAAHCAPSVKIEAQRMMMMRPVPLPTSRPPKPPQRIALSLNLHEDSDESCGSLHAEEDHDEVDDDDAALDLRSSQRERDDTNEPSAQPTNYDSHDRIVSSKMMMQPCTDSTCVVVSPDNTTSTDKEDYSTIPSGGTVVDNIVLQLSDLRSSMSNGYPDGCGLRVLCATCYAVGFFNAYVSRLHFFDDVYGVACEVLRRQSSRERQKNFRFAPADVQLDDSAFTCAFLSIQKRFGVHDVYIDGSTESKVQSLLNEKSIMAQLLDPSLVALVARTRKVWERWISEYLPSVSPYLDDGRLLFEVTQVLQMHPAAADGSCRTSEAFKEEVTKCFATVMYEDELLDDCCGSDDGGFVAASAVEQLSIMKILQLLARLHQRSAAHDGSMMSFALWLEPTIRAMRIQMGELELLPSVAHALPAAVVAHTDRPPAAPQQATTRSHAMSQRLSVNMATSRCAVVPIEEKEVEKTCNKPLRQPDESSELQALAKCIASHGSHTEQLLKRVLQKLRDLEKGHSRGASARQKTTASSSVDSNCRCCLEDSFVKVGRKVFPLALLSLKTMRSLCVHDDVMGKTATPRSASSTSPKGPQIKGHGQAVRSVRFVESFIACCLHVLQERSGFCNASSEENNSNATGTTVAPFSVKHAFVLQQFEKLKTLEL